MAKWEKKKSLPTVSNFLPQNRVFYRTGTHETHDQN